MIDVYESIAFGMDDRDNDTEMMSESESVATTLSAASSSTSHAAIVLNSIRQNNQEQQILLETLLQNSIVDGNLVKLDLPSGQIQWQQRFSENSVSQSEASVGSSVGPRQSRTISSEQNGLNSSQVSVMEEDVESGSVSVNSQRSEPGGRRSVTRQRSGRVSETGRLSTDRSESGSVTPETSVLNNSFSMDDMRHQMTGSVTPETDVGFQPSMLEAVLTEKKLALLRSPEVRTFLQQQQTRRVREQRIAHRSPSTVPRADNS